MSGALYPTMVRGTEIRLTVDETCLVNTGLALFAAVLDRFFGLYAHTNSFTQLVLVSSKLGALLLACPRRDGDVPLL